MKVYIGGKIIAYASKIEDTEYVKRRDKGIYNMENDLARHYDNVLYQNIFAWNIQ